MLNIPLFTIRQHQIHNRCKQLKAADFYIYYKLVFISAIIILIKYIFQKSPCGVIHKYLHIKSFEELS